MDVWIPLAIYLVSIPVLVGLAVWLGKRGGTRLPAFAIVVIALLSPFSLLFLAFWYLNHKPHRDALGPPPG